MGYEQLLEVERGWRDMKSTLELRPVFHRLVHRIRAHVASCWLALLLIRVAKTTTSDMWSNLRHELDLMHLGTFQGAAGTVRWRTASNPAQAPIFRALDLAEPREFSELRPARKPAA